MKSINILVVGAGYVGMSVAAMLVPKYFVKVLEKALETDRMLAEREWDLKRALHGFALACFALLR